jgi:hypothetical protein
MDRQQEHALNEGALHGLQDIIRDLNEGSHTNFRVAREN